jgi:hypothetical protein
MPALRLVQAAFGNTLRPMPTNRVQFLRHNGVEILHINWSDAQASEMLAAMDDARKLIASRPHGSVRTLTTVDGAHMDRGVTNALKDYVEHNKPYVRAGAVVGLNDLKMIAFNFVNRVTGRNLRAMDTVDEAKNWLASVS